MKQQVIKFLLILATFVNFGCSFSAFTVSLTEDILDNSVQTLFEVGDLEYAEKSLPANLTLLEGFHKTDPENKKIALLLIEGYTGYTLGFVEDIDPERAKKLYTKAIEIGLNVLKKDSHFKMHFNENLNGFKNTLQNFSEEDVPLIFWTANAWGNLINLSLNDPEIIKDLYKVNTMMQFVLKNNERYFNGGAHIYFGTILATQPRVLGGNPDLSKSHFEKAISISKNKFLLTNIYFAKSYAVQTQNKELFTSLLDNTISASIDLLPEYRLINAIAKKKAKILLENKEELFE
ncbi:MAG: TRAP transporter TatT component family protein [Bacteroidetes bacterium]|nr:TRAP transporter TatT component family protein [Bacteroidota bacterium]